MARKVDVSLLAQLNAGAVNQEIKKGGFSKTTDPNFPLFSTPVNKDILVYIPMTSVETTENGSNMKLLTLYTHTYKEGNFPDMLRCIHGLSGGVYSEVLNYDGTCPACEAVKDCWSLYNLKMKAEAQKLGIDIQNDTADILKETRKTILNEMSIKGSEEYVVFPIVIIPTEEKSIKPTHDALDNLQVQFVIWTKKRYEKHMLGALEALMDNPGHPAGMFWVWKFTYDTGGKPANARDSAKNSNYLPIQDAKFLQHMTPAKPALEKAAASFTNDKATEVIYSAQYMYKEDLTTKVNKIMAKTRHLIEISETESFNSPRLEVDALANFGGALPSGNIGVDTTVKFEG